VTFASEVVVNQRSRRTDQHGSGQFGAKRGAKLHQGLDIEAQPGEEIRSPIEGDVLREALPYSDDSSFRGLVIRGTGEWSGYEVKMFYVEGLFCGRATPGAMVGRAQNLTFKYPGITNHIHLEVRLNGRVLPPHEIYGLCF